MNKRYSFQKIFEEEGLYVAESFREGVAIQIKKGPLGINEMRFMFYSSPEFFSGTEFHVPIAANFFEKEFVKVYNVYQLFHKKSELFK